MKEKRFLYIVFIVLIVINSCSLINKSKFKSKWRYRILKSGNDKFYQYNRGILVYNNRLVPDNIRTIASPLGVFYNVVDDKSQLLNWTGWVRDENKYTSYTKYNSSKYFMSKDLHRGYYNSKFRDKKKGTPYNWVWIDLGDCQYWIKVSGLFYYSKILSNKK